MSVIGKGAKSLRRKDIATQNTSALATLDSVTPVATGLLPVGATDFVVPPSLYNQNNTQQVGTLAVYRNGLLQARCEGNSLSNSGNYIEVAPLGGTLYSTIRFKMAPANQADNIIVIASGLLVPRPSASQQAELETLGSKMDKVVQVLSDVSGQPQSFFQTSPSQVDLTNFGNTVLDHGNRLNTLESSFGGLVFGGGSYTPVSTWGAGVAAGSNRAIYTATYIRLGNFIHVTGAAFFRNDVSTVNFNWTLPVTNANTPVNIAGTMCRVVATGETLAATSRLNASANNSSTITWSNTGINTPGTDCFWTYSFVYTLV